MCDGESRFTVTISDRRSGTAHVITDLRLAMPGDHNALNARARLPLRTSSVSPMRTFARVCKGFAGVKRRFTGQAFMMASTVFDDYGHHPVEIAAVLGAAREGRQETRDRRHAAAPLYAACRICSTSSAAASTMPMR